MLAKSYLDWIFFTVITLLLFSIWAAFALLVINPLFHEDLPGYKIGRICIWELAALIVAAIVARIMIKHWGSIQKHKVGTKSVLTIDPRYATFFLIYFIFSCVIAIWQFWKFSQGF